MTEQVRMALEPAGSRSGAASTSGQEPAIQAWYDGNAQRFAEADCIEEAFTELDAEGQRRLNDFKLHAVRQRITFAGQDVIEFGAGHGRLALAYPDMKRYSGVDYSKELVAIGNRRLAKAGLADRAHIVVGNALDYEDDHRYDIVCSLGMMAYFPDPTATLTRMFRLVKPGGILFFDFRCNTVPYEAIRRVKWMLQAPTGGRSYTMKERVMRKLVTSLGASEVEIVSREFPLLGGLYAKGSDWPMRVRDSIAGSTALRQFATEAWVFARRPTDSACQ